MKFTPSNYFDNSQFKIMLHFRIPKKFVPKKLFLENNYIILSRQDIYQ